MLYDSRYLYAFRNLHRDDAMSVVCAHVTVDGASTFTSQLKFDEYGGAVVYLKLIVNRDFCIVDDATKLYIYVVWMTMSG